MSMKNNGKIWSESAVNFLKEKAREGWNRDSIAGVLHRSPEAVARKARRLSLSFSR